MQIVLACCFRILMGFTFPPRLPPTIILPQITYSEDIRRGGLTCVSAAAELLCCFPPSPAMFLLLVLKIRQANTGTRSLLMGGQDVVGEFEGTDSPKVCYKRDHID